MLSMNDFNSFTKDSKFINFADYGTLYTKDKSLSGMAAKINTELHTIIKWLQINRLSLNVSKSLFTVFSSASKAHIPALAINGINLVYFTTTEFLGILVNNKLNFCPAYM